MTNTTTNGPTVTPAQLLAMIPKEDHEIAMIDPREQRPGRIIVWFGKRIEGSERAWVQKMALDNGEQWGRSMVGWTDAAHGRASSARDLARALTVAAAFADALEDAVPSGAMLADDMRDGLERMARHVATGTGWLEIDTTGGIVEPEPPRRMSFGNATQAGAELGIMGFKHASTDRYCSDWMHPDGRTARVVMHAHRRFVDVIVYAKGSGVRA